jgi:hypothetical protein
MEGLIMSGRDGILPIEKQAEIAVIKDLPRSIRDIGETYDLRLVIRLVQEFGGVRVKVPKRLHERSEFVKRLGVDDAEKIIYLCGGGELDVPRSLIRRAARKQTIISMYNKGFTQAQIAREVGCTDRQVRNYLASAGLNRPVVAPPPKKQIDFFE